MHCEKECVRCKHVIIRRKCIKFKEDRYDMTNLTFQEGLSPESEKFICKKCDTSLPKCQVACGNTPQKQNDDCLAKPCILCKKFKYGQMKIFEKEEYGKNTLLDRKVNQNSICKACHSSLLMYCEKECIGCKRQIVHRSMVKYDSYKH